MIYSVHVFNHESPNLPMKEVGAYKSRKEAMLIGCKIIHTLTKDYNEELYVFMQTKEVRVHNMFRSGVHIYNGNVPWSVFVTGAKTEPALIGPLTLKEEKGMFDFSLADQTPFEC